MTFKLKTIIGVGAALAMAATLQVVSNNVALAYNAGLSGVAECQADGSIKVDWTFTSDTNVPVVDITSPSDIAEGSVPTTTNGVPTTRSFTRTYSPGTTSAGESVTVTYFYDPPGTVGLQTDVTTATIALPGDDCLPETGGEWCSPGYWRQPQHLDSWAATGFSTTDRYNALFDPDLAGNPTLLEVLQSPQRYNRGTGSFNRVGDLLSGAHPDVDFDGERVENCPLN